MPDVPRTTDRQRLKWLLMTSRKSRVPPIFSQIGGARIGVWNASWPLAWLSATRADISVRCWFNYTFPKRNIQRLSRHRGWFSTGLCIEHDIPDYSPFFVFWTLDFAKLKRELEALGYEVHDPLAS